MFDGNKNEFHISPSQHAHILLSLRRAAVSWLSPGIALAFSHNQHHRHHQWKQTRSTWNAPIKRSTRENNVAAYEQKKNAKQKSFIKHIFYPIKRWHVSVSADNLVWSLYCLLLFEYQKRTAHVVAWNFSISRQSNTRRTLLSRKKRNATNTRENITPNEWKKMKTNKQTGRWDIFIQRLLVICL